MISRRAFWAVVCATVVVRLLLAVTLPLTGDEAYFYVWARHLDYGYYDHPPMVGWLLWPLQRVSAAVWLSRMPAVLIPLVVGAGIYRVAARYGVERARWATALFLLSPLYLVLPLTTTDTPLLLLTFLSVLALQRALEEERLTWYVAAGICLGLAFLSKYFAVLLGIAYLAFFLAHARSAARWRGFAVLVLSALPLVAVNVVWNYYHCWDNILFNLFNRNAHTTVSVLKLAQFLALQIYLITPLPLYYLLRERSSLGARVLASRCRLFVYAIGIPLLVFLALSLAKSIGLHWTMAFYPFLYIVLAATLEPWQLRRSTWFMGIFAALHVVVIGALLLTPITVWRSTKLYPDIVALLHTKAVAARLSAYGPRFRIATTGYTPSALLAHALETDVPVFGPGSRHARQDDMLTDFRRLAGRDIAILTNGEAPADLAPYFNRTEVRSFELKGARFTVVLGYGFRFEPYRRRVLEQVRERFYRIPSWLPTGGCVFCSRYFADRRCGLN